MISQRTATPSAVNGAAPTSPQAPDDPARALRHELVTTIRAGARSAALAAAHVRAELRPVLEQVAALDRRAAELEALADHAARIFGRRNGRS